MGQAFRRAAGGGRRSGLDTASSVQPASVKPPPPRPRPPGGAVTRVTPNGEGNSADTSGSGIEERDPRFDQMLNQMVGRITAKPGGKPEVGEAFITDKYNRPLPKLRNTKLDSGRYEDRAAPPGTLNVAQLRHIMLLYQGKADDHDGPMNAKDIAQRFRLDVAQLEKMLQFVSLPPQDGIKTKQ